MFYSRRIGRRPHYYPDLKDGDYADVPDFTTIIGAAKVTGKTTNGWSVGVLESLTAEENAKINGISKGYTQAVEPLTNYIVGRVQKDFNDGNSNIGGIITGVNRNLKDEHLRFLHKNAYTGGIDFMHQWKDKKWIMETGAYFSRVEGTVEALLRTQTSYSRTYQRPDADYVTLDSTRTSLSGYGGKFSIGKVSGRLKYGGMFNWKSPGLEINDIGFSPSVDEMLQILWAGYRWYEPFSIFRNANININQWTAYDFGGNMNVTGGNINGHAQFKNFWSTFGMFNMEGEVLSNATLRGGPSLKLPGDKRFYMGVSTNNQKKLSFGIDGGMSWSNEKDFSSRKSIDFEVGYRPFKAMQIEIEPEYSVGDDKLQYVTQNDYLDGKQYTMSQIHRKTISTSIRINYSITPDLTIQYWGQPFIATGEYSDFKYISNSKANDVYDRFELYNKNQIAYDKNLEEYLIDFNEDGSVDYSFGKPDFNVQEFLSNLVLRWEYNPGSIIYLVWSQNRSAYTNTGNLHFENDIGSLFSETPNNIFLLKFSYRIGR